MASTTAIAKHMGCKRQTILSRHFRKFEKESEALSFGKAYHASIEGSFNSGVIELDKYGINTNKNYQLLHAMYTRFQMFAMINDIEILEHEYRFNIKIAEDLDETMEGYIDGIVRFRGEIWLLELKTARAIDVSSCVFDSQLTTYLWACRHDEKLKAYNPKGILYIVNQKGIDKEPQVNKNGTMSVAFSQGCSPEAYLKKCIDVYGGVENIPPRQEEFYNDLKKSYQPRLVCVPVTRTSFELDMYDSQIEGLVRDLASVKHIMNTEGFVSALKKTPYFPTKYCHDTCFSKKECVACHMALAEGVEENDVFDESFYMECTA
ncbi:MAG: PD-(D/E)XK nuclease family protein [Cellulosilyticaceae bacterium]